MNYTVKDGSHIKTVLTADSPLCALAQYVETYLPDDEQNKVAAVSTKTRCIATTENHSIEVRAETLSVAAA